MRRRPEKLLRPYSLNEISQIVGGQILQDAPGFKFTRVGIDSRRIEPGDLFVAIPGERADGHDFVTQSFLGGAMGAIVQKPVTKPTESKTGLLLVDSTTDALQKLAAHCRGEKNVKVIGITGSVGKTSTKDLAWAVVSRQFASYKSQGNLNSHIGLPLSVLAMDGPYQLAIVEMAMRQRGEISRLCEIARPEIGILTDISASHIGILGNLDEIAMAKAELLESLPPNGVAILNGDNRLVIEVSQKARCETLLYGFGESVHCRGVNVKSLGGHGSSFGVIYRGSRYEFVLKIPGAHQVHNALAAILLGFTLGMPHAKIQDGLLNVRLSPMRLDFLRGIGITIIDDSYNASPKSTKAALDLLETSGKGRKIAVLGEMLEMGKMAPSAHHEIGAYAKQKADFLVSIGDLGKHIVEGWKQEDSPHGGQVSRDYEWFPCKEAAVDFLKSVIKCGDIILVKASRGCGLESVVGFLKRFDFSKDEHL